MLAPSPATASLAGWLQVTKAPRAAAALVLAPAVDRLMGWLQRVCNLQSRRQVGRGTHGGAGRLRLAGVAPCWLSLLLGES